MKSLPFLFQHHRIYLYTFFKFGGVWSRSHSIALVGLQTNCSWTHRDPTTSNVASYVLELKKYITWRLGGVGICTCAHKEAKGLLAPLELVLQAVESCQVGARAELSHSGRVVHIRRAACYKNEYTYTIKLRYTYGVYLFLIVLSRLSSFLLL